MEWAFYDNLILCPAHKRSEDGFVQCSWCNHEVKWELSMAIQHIGSFLYEVRRGLYQILDLHILGLEGTFYGNPKLGTAHISSKWGFLWQSYTGRCTHARRRLSMAIRNRELHTPCQKGASLGNLIPGTANTRSEEGLTDTLGCTQEIRKGFYLIYFLHTRGQKEAFHGIFRNCGLHT